MAELCGVKQHVLRHWEQEFSQLKPMKRNGNRRYYQHHEVLLVRCIRELLHEQATPSLYARTASCSSRRPRPAGRLVRTGARVRHELLQIRKNLAG